MDKLSLLYEFAEENNIRVFHPRIGQFKSLIIQNQTSADILLDFKCIRSTIEEKECLAHEVGHFSTGAYYKPNTNFETKERCEYRANRWAVMNCIPFNELINALHNGITKVWELAEYFNVTEDFIRLAIDIYIRQGKLPHKIED